LEFGACANKIAQGVNQERRELKNSKVLCPQTVQEDGEENGGYGWT